MPRRTAVTRWAGWMAELARDLGPEAARTLAEQCGGTRLYVPGTVSPRLVQLVGQRTAVWLVDRFGGQRIYVPVLDPRIDQARRARALRAMGMTVDAIARAVGRSHRWVERVLQEA